MAGQRLHLSVERRSPGTDEMEEQEATSPQMMRRELRYGFFSRDLQLPAGVTEEDITATYADGILEVRVHLPYEAPPTRIAVTAR
jgi:HSP20 family protein